GAPSRVRPGPRTGPTGRAARPRPGARLYGCGRPAPVEGQLEYARDEGVEVDPGGLCRLRKQARLGEARDGVGLEHVELPRRLVEHQVDAAEAVEPEQVVDADRQRPGSRRVLLVELRGADEVRPADLVTRLEVVGVLLARN